MSGKNHLKKMIDEQRRRLRRLELQRATFGNATEPHILNEIEDIEAEIAQRQEELATLEEISPLNPYRGLSAFREEDEPFFFGRETFTAQLVASVKQKPLVTVLGPSGSGKSSIVFAGLLSRLRHEGTWLIATFRPGSSPFFSLANALVPLLEPNLSKIKQVAEARDLADRLYQGRSPLSDYIHSIHQTFPNHHLLLIVDQLEELYTLTEKAEIHHQFIVLLLRAINTNISSVSTGLHLVLTLRADFLGQALLSPEFGDALQDNVKLLRPMNPDELRMVIENPAGLQDVHFDTGLVERILADVSNEPGSLPLLEFALTILWEQQEQGKLTHTAYKAIGGVGGALSRHADEVFDKFSTAEQEQVRRVFIQMVQPGEGMDYTRRLVTKAELGEINWILVQLLATERMIVTDRSPDGQETVEVVHEALIRGWGRLLEWIDHDQSFLAWRKRLRFTSDQWHPSRQDDGILLRGKPLVDAAYWLAERENDLSRDERDFIQASQNLQERERRRERVARRFRRLAIVLSIVLPLLIVLLLGRSWWSSNCPRYSSYCPAIRLLGFDLFRINLPGANFSRANLAGANFSRANLAGADLSRANLIEADLPGADLSRANLIEADLAGADLSQATLFAAKLIEANLNTADLAGADLSQTILSRADLIEADLAGADLTRAILNQADLAGADLSQTILSRADLIEADLTEANLAGATLLSANLTEATLLRANLTEANLIQADLPGADLTEATLLRAILLGANLTGANLTGANLTGANLLGANLTGANLTGAELDKAVFNKETIWPDTFDPEKTGAMLVGE